MKLENEQFILEDGEGVTLAQIARNGSTFPLPTGSYRLRLSTAYTKKDAIDFSVVEGGSIRLRVPLTPNRIGKRLGLAAPSLAGLVDLKGRPLPKDGARRPLLIYFWAEWCTPCIEHSIPELIDFTSHHPSIRDQVLAIRVNGLGANISSQKFPLQVSALEERLWKRRVPFKMAYDVSGEITKTYSLQTLPTYFLIDAKGRLQPGDNLGDLAKSLLPKKR